MAVPKWFADLLVQYLAAWGQPLTHERLTSYWEVLEPQAPEDVTAASLALRRFRARDEFPPSAAAWFEAAEQQRRERLVRETLGPIAREEPWHEECFSCHDTGWVVQWCPGVGVPSTARDERAAEADDQPCGRRAWHRGHTHVRACACRPHNRTYQRHHQPRGG